jgi:hypothetical protein
VFHTFSDPETHPGRATQFKPGNPGRSKDAKPISERRARKLVKQAIIAKVAGTMKADFDGDALSYMQACYRGEIKPDPLRMSAAATALKYEKPALAATVQTVVDLTQQMTPEQRMSRMGELAKMLGLKLEPALLASPSDFSVVDGTAEEIEIPSEPAVQQPGSDYESARAKCSF